MRHSMPEVGGIGVESCLNAEFILITAPRRAGIRVSRLRWHARWLRLSETRRASMVLGSRLARRSTARVVKSQAWLEQSRMRWCSLQVALKQTTSLSGVCAKLLPHMVGTLLRLLSSTRRFSAFVRIVTRVAGRLRGCRYLTMETIH